MTLLNKARAMCAELLAPLNTAPQLNSSSRSDSGGVASLVEATCNGPLELTGFTPAPCPADVSERAAIIAEGCGCPADVAAAQALAEHNLASWEALAAIHAAQIRRALNRLPPPSTWQGARLLATTRDFIASPWLARSVTAGWSMVELFGISAVAPSARLDKQGLVTGLALSALPRLRMVAIEPDHARLAGRLDAPLTYRRFSLDPHAATLWWECRVIVGDPDAA